MAVTLAALLFASSAPSPLYVIYQEQWDFSALTLTGVFAVYAIALLSALLVAGSLSDHLGRRPVLLAALAVEIVAMLVFAVAPSVAWLFAARILQGLATGVAMGCISAALLDLQPPERDWQGALTGVVAPLSGLAAGAVFAGVLADQQLPTRSAWSSGCCWPCSWPWRPWRCSCPRPCSAATAGATRCDRASACRLTCAAPSPPRCRRWSPRGRWAAWCCRSALRSPRSWWAPSSHFEAAAAHLRAGRHQRGHVVRRSPRRPAHHRTRRAQRPDRRRGRRAAGGGPVLRRRCS